MKIKLMQKEMLGYDVGVVNMQGHNSIVSLLNLNRFIEFTKDTGTYVINTDTINWIKEYKEDSEES